MNPWPTVVPVEQTDPAKLYFVARGSPGRFMFYSRGLNGKCLWSVKPGIGIRCEGGQPMIDVFEKNAAKGMTLVAVEVPDDADKRWRARKRRFR